jgi:hypothetical protein
VAFAFGPTSLSSYEFGWLRHSTWRGFYRSDGFADGNSIGYKMDLLKRPQRDGKYPDRDIDCQEALQKAFLEVASVHAATVVDAAGGKLLPVMLALAKRAEGSGWSLEEAEVAISELAQNLLDDEASE